VGEETGGAIEWGVGLQQTVGKSTMDHKQTKKPQQEKECMEGHTILDA
jgi:hypothetical protein